MLLFDTSTTGGGAANPVVVSLTPIGIPRAIIAFIYGSPHNTDAISSVTYGGVAMTRVPGAPQFDVDVETMSCFCYFLGKDIPPGTQNISVSHSAAGYLIDIVSMTGAMDARIVDSKFINSISLADPSVTLLLKGNPCIVFIGFGSGQDAVGGVSTLAGWSTINISDDGTVVFGTHIYSIVVWDDIAAGWTQTAEDAIAVAIAVTDAPLNRRGNGMAITQRMRRR